MTSIACDGRALAGPLTGVGTWTEQVVGGLARNAGNRLSLAASRPIDLPPLLVRDNVLVLPPPHLPVPGTVWLHTLLGRQLQNAGTQVWLASLAVVPRRCPVPAVAVVHDLTPRTSPHRHTLANRFCFNAYVEESLDRAAAVVTVSAATRAAVAETFPWVGSRLHHIANGVDRFFSPAPPLDDGGPTRRRFSGGRPYLLHLGTLEPRKGLSTLVAAWELLHELVAEPPDLVLAGRPGWGISGLLRQIDRCRYRQRIHRPGYVSREDARSLLRHAEVFVLPSEAEGFGLPLAEALSCAIPCVASNIPPLREVAGEAALFSPPGDHDALARTVAAALQPATRASLRAAATTRAEDLRWQPAISRWQQLLDSVAIQE